MTPSGKPGKFSTGGKDVNERCSAHVPDAEVWHQVRALSEDV